MQNKKAYLVIFQARIGGEDAQTEIATVKDPMNSLEVRQDCEDVASASFFKLSQASGKPWDGKLKCVECVEFKEPETEQ